jgi:putative inorganic carbon (HCO3(-)) transporter
MNRTEQALFRVAQWSMLISAGAVVVSIAVCQIFLGLALIAWLASEAPLRFPPIKAPLFAFLGLTVVSMMASGHPGSGLPQIRKFFVYSILLVASSVLLEARHARWLAGAWFLGAAASALKSLVQFTRKLEVARARGEDFYQFYVGERITGFLSHWMSFSEVGMIVLLVLLAYVFFAPNVSRGSRLLSYLAAAIVGASLLISFTRSIWLATAAAACYLVWCWRKRLLLALPVLLLIAIVAGPGAFRQRVESIFVPQADRSVSARKIMWRTGARMIRAHPVLGVGPGRVGPEFTRYLPSDVIELPEAFYEHLHNLYIHTAAERGIPAVLALLWLLGRILRDNVRALGKAPPGDDRFILHAVVAVMIALLIGGFFELNLGDSEVLTVFLTLVSLGYTAINRQQEALFSPRNSAHSVSLR